MSKKKIIIVGGGFGGIKAAMLLSRQSNFDVTLISDKDDFIYYPSLYAVATGGSKRQSFVPLRTILKNYPVQFIRDTIEGYDPDRHLLSGKNGHYSYDKVVFALGVVTSYFGIKGLDTYSFGIKSAEEVQKFLDHLHEEMVSDHKLDRQYVIVGAGPTGVELSSSLASHIAHIADAHDVRHKRIRIKLVEAAPRVLPRMSEDASALVDKRLRDLGVEVMTNEKVEWQDDDEVFVSGRSIPTHTVVWTSGVTNNPFFEQHSEHFPLAPNKKVIVDEHMMVHHDTYVIGDNAMTPYSGLAQTALHDAIYVAKDITRSCKKHPRPAYKPLKPPVVIPVGKRWAILEWNFILIVDYVGHLIRRAADFVGYSDMLPIGLAFHTWQAEYQREYTCDSCRNYKG